jgi:hypothetical protein
LQYLPVPYFFPYSVSADTQKQGSLQLIPAEAFKSFLDDLALHLFKGIEAKR